ncbi:MAG: hypothetical protein Q4G51_08040 [Dermatophilus congolensis]|nr:hypothetical protein [Dermatophilus congolensis]
MSATLRIHRGPASPDRVLLVDGHEMGTLSEEVTDFSVPLGRHLIALKLGIYHSVATSIVVADGQVLDLTVEDNPDAVLPIIQGGFLRFHKD